MAETTEKPRIGKIEVPITPDYAAIAKLRARFPKIFRKKPRPLKIGIRWDLIEASAPPRAIAAALEHYTSTREYFMCCRSCRKRYDMRGFPDGAVTAAEQDYADQCLSILDLIDGLLSSSNSK